MFKIFKSRSILSLLLVFAMTLSLLPGTAFATDTDTGEHIHTEDCSHEEESLDNAFAVHKGKGNGHIRRFLPQLPLTFP